jgi:regulator of PEP synthase PpsR (kinase-PPPase family)
MQRTVFVVSDATGHTAERVVQAALVQFAPKTIDLHTFARVRNAEDITRIVALAGLRDALVVHTLVNADLRNMLTELGQNEGVVCHDLFGGLLSTLGAFLELAPTGTPGVPIALDETYFRRVEAMEFTVASDDGQSQSMLERADIVLVGVSRTSKTPLSAYLAAQGYKVANVPLTLGIDPPPALFALPPGRVFALTLDPQQLTEIRQRRVAQYGFEDPGRYADADHVFHEVGWALQMIRQRSSWPILDVTRLTVEESAAELLKLKQQIEAAERA